VAKKESSFVGLRLRESGTRVMRFGAERREAVQGMRRKGSLESEGAIFLMSFGFGESVLGQVYDFSLASMMGMLSWELR
jgi:hypothetical protein